jgi:phosphoribosyl-AMP cyclohydrolase
MKGGKTKCKKLNIKFDSKGLMPAIVQDYKTGEILMVAYMNEEALSRTLNTRKAWFFSRSRNKLWLKGETSGNVLKVTGIYLDCDRDCVLLKVKLDGVACHTGYKSCFFTSVSRTGGTRITGKKPHKK